MYNTDKDVLPIAYPLTIPLTILHYIVITKLSKKNLDYENKKGNRDEFFYFHCNNLEAVRKDNYKLHLIKRELYNLSLDIGECNNIYDQHPDIVKDFKPMTVLDPEHPYMIAMYD